MMFSPSWPPKWKKIGSAKKLLLNFGIQRKGCTYKYLKNKKRLSYLLPASRGSNVMTFTQS